MGRVNRPSERRSPARARRGGSRPSTPAPSRGNPRSRRARGPPRRSQSWNCETVPPRPSSAASTGAAPWAADQLDDETLLVGRPNSRQHPVRDDAERPQRDQRRDGRDERRLPVAGARRHADPGDEPERRRRRQAATVETLTDDRARTEEADPGHDLRRDPCWIERDPLALGEAPVRPRVGGDQEEERGAERDQQVCAKPRFALAKLPLETDRTAERSRDESLTAMSIHDSSGNASSCARAISAIPPDARSSSSSSSSRVNGAPSAVACTSTSLPSPVITTFMSASAVESSVYSRSSSGSPSTIPTETAATDPTSAFERPNLSSARRAATTRRRSPRSACRRRPAARRSRANRALSERLEVDDASECAADQPLDLDRAAALLPARRLARDTFSGRRRQQRILGGHPALALVAQPARDVVVDHRRAEDLRLALRPQERSRGAARGSRARPSVAGAHPRDGPLSSTRSSSSSSTCSTSRIGSCRNRAPVSRKTSGSPVVMKR